MLWYLLYPIRGTTQPPRLSANHPIRRAFYRHGKTTAEHWLVAMLVTVAIAMAFSYPTILLAENPTAGLASYPHHVWTTAKPFDENPDNPDVEMRQVWIHGSYMRALEKDVLKSALDIQQTLIDRDSWTSIFPSLRSSSTLSWGYHSPLMYWNNSRQIIDHDDDILQTINRQAGTTSSSLNVALRPASVFAGKKFEHRRLTAADALVITLINKGDGNVGSQWRDRMATLTTGACKDCTLFPSDGHVTRSRVYEFSFTPLSAQENVALTIAYSFMALYVLLSLRRLKAFHSRFGLVVTAITQMTCSILASFTICNVLKINLSMIPQNAYPFVVLVIGLENMFRIINAVLAYPPTMATDLRIANALGDVGPVSVATAAQHIIILSLLASVVSPGVAAFCAFACIATLFDSFFLLTFFVAVLMVDIRRFELQDALSRANQSKHKRKPSPIHHHTWFDALVRGRLPFSTRMAGTAVTTTFILSLNYHFFEHKEQATSLRHLFRLIKNGPPNLGDFDTFAPLPINATMTPGQWMRMQDFDTAKEVMRLAKPGGDSFVIRIFAPLIVVLSGADRTGVEEQEWTTALRSFAIHHFYPVATAVVFAVAFVAVLMNFLLYTEHEDEQNLDMEDEGDALQLSNITLPHRLDIVKLSTNDKGHLVTVGLDRTIAISLFNRAQQSHRVLSPTNDFLSRVSWPIHNINLDENGDLIACHCGDERVMFYNVANGSIMSDSLPYPDDNPPILFHFLRLHNGDAWKPHFIILTSAGRLHMINVETGEAFAKRLTSGPIVGALVVGSTQKESKLFVVTEEGQAAVFIWDGKDWTHGKTRSLDIHTSTGRLTGHVPLQQFSELGSDLLIVVTALRVLILDSHSLSLLCKADMSDDASATNFTPGQSIKCPTCRQLAIRSATIIGENAAGGEVVTTSLGPTNNETAICLSNGTPQCCSLESAQRTTHRISNPGAWSAVTSQAVLGLRKPSSASTAREVRSKAADLALLRQRRRARKLPHSIDAAEDTVAWEAYRLSTDGEMDTVNVVGGRNDVAQLANTTTAELYVTNSGPAVALDAQAIAVAWGNVVKIVRCGKGARVTGRSRVRVLETEAQGRKMR